MLHIQAARDALLFATAAVFEVALPPAVHVGRGLQSYSHYGGAMSPAPRALSVPRCRPVADPGRPVPRKAIATGDRYP